MMSSSIDDDNDFVKEMTSSSINDNNDFVQVVSTENGDNINIDKDNKSDKNSGKVLLTEKSNLTERSSNNDTNSSNTIKNYDLSSPLALSSSHLQMMSSSIEDDNDFVKEMTSSSINDDNDFVQVVSTEKGDSINIDKNNKSDKNSEKVLLTESSNLTERSSNNDTNSSNTIKNSTSSSSICSSNGSSVGLLPCIEQPLRVTLHCNNYYLWCERKGKVVARKKRSEKDEFRLCYQHNEKGRAGGSKGGVVTIQSHKYKGYLSVITDRISGTSKVVCVKDDLPGKKENDLIKTVEKRSNNDELKLNNDTAPTKKSIVINDGDDEDEVFLDSHEDEDDNDDDDENTIAMDTTNMTLEDREWCFVKSASRCGGVMLKSLKTGKNLGLDQFGNLIFVSDSNNSNNEIGAARRQVNALWSIECVTGELCFISNPVVKARIRCDLAGVVTCLSDNWKGWEVFRLMEAGDHGYIKISSWMHSQWLLCSNSEGLVSTCSHAESFLEEDEHDGDGNITKGGQNCFKWAIEKGPSGNGVIIRSKRYGRLLSVKDGTLETYFHESYSLKKPERLQSTKHKTTSTSTAALAAEEHNSDRPSGNTPKFPSSGNSTATAVATSSFKSKTSPWMNKISLTKMQTDMKGMQHKMQNDMKGMQDTFQRTSSTLNTSMKKMQNDMKGMQDHSMKRMQVNFHSAATKAKGQLQGNTNASSSLDRIKQKDTIFWHLESAHLQNYYLSNLIPGEKPVSIGPFPAVTSNFRKTDVFQLQRKLDGAITRFYNAEKDQYVACHADGTIRYVNTDDEEDESTQWIMDKQSYQKGENVFQSKLTHLYLSYTEGTPVKKQEDKKGEMLTSDRCNKKDPLLETKELFSNLFTTATTTTKAAVTTISSKAGVVTPEAVSCELVGSKTINKRSIWRLDPCMPRAVSSQKIKTFAIGTSIAVGTTVAMPFALAGVGALLGAVGAEVGIVANVIFAGLTGVEALASVGAIGATAYIVFRPEENSLTDDHDEDDDEKEEKAWSKRPFSNWRNW